MCFVPGTFSFMRERSRRDLSLGSVERYQAERAISDQDVIRRISRITGDAFCEDLDMRVALRPDEVSPELKSANEKLALIYRLAHSHDTSARCYRVHDDWRKLMKEKP